MARVWLVAVALTLGAATPEPPGSDYDLVWTAFAREVRWQTGESQPVAAGERSGRARARLIRTRPGVLRLEWRGAGGGRPRPVWSPRGPRRSAPPTPALPPAPPPAPPARRRP